MILVACNRFARLNPEKSGPFFINQDEKVSNRLIKRQKNNNVSGGQTSCIFSYYLTLY